MNYFFIYSNTFQMALCKDAEKLFPKGGIVQCQTNTNDCGPKTPCKVANVPPEDRCNACLKFCKRKSILTSKGGILKCRTNTNECGPKKTCTYEIMKPKDFCNTCLYNCKSTSG